MTQMAMNSAIAERARSGALLTEAELLELDTCDVLTLGMLADEVRRLRVGDQVSYARVLEVGPEWDAHADAVVAGLQAADEVRLVTPGITIGNAAALVARVRADLGRDRRLTGFCLARLVEQAAGDLGPVLSDLRAAGLDALAEAPVDGLAPDALATAVAAGLAPAVLGVARWPGDGRIGLLMRMRRAVEAAPAVRRIAPLSREQSVTAPSTGYHDVRMVALARLALPTITDIEVDWQQYGPKLAQVALMFGASHLDRVSPLDDPALGHRRATVQEVRRNIIAAGFVPADRGGAV